MEQSFQVPLDQLLSLLNRKVLFQVRWKVDEDSGNQFLAQLTRKARHEPGLFAAVKMVVPSISLLDDGMAVRVGIRAGVLSFPGAANPILDLLLRDASPTLFAVTLGQEVVDRGARLMGAGEFQKYFLWYGLCAELAEAAAEWAEQYIARQAGPGVPTRRFSPGYPVWPNLEDQGVLMAVLDGETMGLTITSEFQLVPEFTVTGLVVSGGRGQS